MPKECIFCEKSSGSKEHLWAAWIHRQKQFGSIRVAIGDSASIVDNNPEQTIDTVCRKCNNEWMSLLEQDNREVIIGFLRDKPSLLNLKQQTMLSAWAVKTSMVLDSVKHQLPAPLFYDKLECVAMRLNQGIPERTRIWIGRYCESSLGADGTDVRIISADSLKYGVATVSTFVVGYMAIQVVTMHIYPEYVASNVEDVQPKPGDWSNMLISLWPISAPTIAWPPRITFRNSGALSIAHLMDRWRLGKKVPGGTIF